MNGTLSISNNSPVDNYQENYLQLTLWPSFIHSFFLLLFAELGDQTFITLLFFLMKFQDASTTLLFACLLTLLGMNTLSVGIGYSIDFLVHKSVIDWIGLVLFICYGIKIFYKGWELKPKSLDEELLDCAQKELNEARQRRCKSAKLKKELTIISELRREDSLKYEDSFKEPLLRKEVTTDLQIIPELSSDLLDSQREPTFHEPEEPPQPFDWPLFWTFVKGLLLAGCGDRTQAISILMGAMFNIYGVLLGTTLAIMTTIILAIAFGECLSKWKWLNFKNLSIATGVIFIGVGIEVFIMKKY